MSDIGPAIRQRGFRKWYERELLAGHAHLVLLVLAVLGVLGALEAAAQHRAAGQGWLLMALCGVAAGAVGVLALRRYLFLLVRAEHIANQANCPQCRAYARWSVEPTAPPGPAASVLQVRCKACHTHWSIHC